MHKLRFFAWSKLSRVPLAQARAAKQRAKKSANTHANVGRAARRLLFARRVETRISNHSGERGSHLRRGIRQFGCSSQRKCVSPFVRRPVQLTDNPSNVSRNEAVISLQARVTRLSFVPIGQSSWAMPCRVSSSFRVYPRTLSGITKLS